MTIKSLISTGKPSNIVALFNKYTLNYNSRIILISLLCIKLHTQNFKFTIYMIFHVEKWHYIQSTKNFAEIAADSHNYLSWDINIKILLTKKEFVDDVNKPNPKAHFSDITKYTTSFLETSFISKSQELWKRIYANFGLHSNNTMINKRQLFV